MLLCSASLESMKFTQRGNQFCQHDAGLANEVLDLGTEGEKPWHEVQRIFVDGRRRNCSHTAWEKGFLVTHLFLCALPLFLHWVTLMISRHAKEGKTASIFCLQVLFPGASTFPFNVSPPPFWNCFLKKMQWENSENDDASNGNFWSDGSMLFVYPALESSKGLTVSITWGMSRSPRLIWPKGTVESSGSCSVPGRRQPEICLLFAPLPMS